MKKNAYLFIYPMLIIAAIGIAKYLIININSILLAFSITDASGNQIPSLLNFQKILNEFTTPGSGMWEQLGNTILYYAMYMFKTCVSFAVAYFLYKKIWGYKIFRVVFYIPSIVSPIVFCNVWISMLSNGGIIQRLWELGFGLEYTNPLTQTGSATFVILTYSFWAGFGTTLLIFVGAMNRIPGEVIDAGLIDGCGMGREFISIVTPMVWETLSTMLLLTSMSIFTASGPILYFTQGGFGTSTISFFIFYKTWKDGAYNYASAVGFFFTVIALPLVALGRWLMNRKNADVTY